MESLKKFLIGFFVASALILVSCPQPNSNTGGGGSTTEETGGSGSGSGGETGGSETGGGQTGEQGSGETGGGEVTSTENVNISAINIPSASGESANRQIADGTNVKMTTTTYGSPNYLNYSYYTSNLLRWYKDTALTFEGKNGKKIKSVVLTAKGENYAKKNVTVGDVGEDSSTTTKYKFSPSTSKGSCTYDSGSGLIYTYTAPVGGVDVVSISATTAQIRLESIVVTLIE